MPCGIFFKWREKQVTPAESQTNPSRHDRASQWDPEELSEQPSLAPLVRLLWSYRRVIAAAVSVALILAVLAGLLAYLRQPVERQASLEFRLVFEGADRQEYPNGLKFSRAEIISTPVLAAVFDKNDLGRYCTYDEFKGAIFVLEASKDLELLSLEFQSRLSDSKLSAVERTRIEEEFRQRREALRVPQYTLNFLSSGAVAKLPDVLMNKVLSDILTTWVEQAADTKGVLNYQVGLLTPAAVSREMVVGDDLLISIDVLRGKIRHILQDLDKLDGLPGASTIRVGEGRVSLTEIRLSLEDVERYRLEPLAWFVGSAGLSDDSARLLRYLESRLEQVRLDRREAVATVATLRESLGTYLMERGSGGSAQLAEGSGPLTGQPGTSTVIPQFSESFLDRLVELSSQGDDVRYRQALIDRMIAAGQSAVRLEREMGYYEGTIASVRRGSGRRAATETLAEASAAFEKILASINRSVEQANDLYQQISAHNLNPRTQLVTITSPFLVRTLRRFTVRSLGMYVVVAFLLSLMVAPLGCLIHHYLTTEGPLARRQPANAAATAEHAEPALTGAHTPAHPPA